MGASNCVRELVEVKGVCPAEGSNNNNYTALDWAEYSMEQGINGCEDIIAYLRQIAAISTGPGYNMFLHRGWSPGTPLGAKHSGLVEPLSIEPLKRKYMGLTSPEDKQAGELRPLPLVVRSSSSEPRASE